MDPSVLSNCFDWMAAVAGLVLLVCAGLIVSSRAGLKKLRQAAFSDPVTGGLTEACFRAEARKMLSGRSGRCALVSMEAENLPQIRRSFGIEAGGRMLKHLHGVLKSQLSGGEVAARTGEDTFCFLLKNRDKDEIRARLDRICEAADRFSQSGGAPYRLRLKFGIYLPEADGEDLTDMQSKAALARLGGTADQHYHFYSRESREKTGRERDLAGTMDRSLQSGEFVVYFQPKVRLSDQRVVGAEALIRWRHPQRGLLSPDMFLPLAEHYQKINRLDRFVFEEVCRALARWKKQGREPCPVSVNLAREDLERSDFLDDCCEVCRRYQVAPSQIEFELKEALLLENLERAKSRIQELHALGFQCALDNFGTELSSLRLLGELDLDTVKLDRSFFYGENNNRRGRYIVETILKLTAQLHIRTVAEGIDNQGQVQYLQQAACDMVQGFYYFKPMPLEKFESEVYAGGALKYVETGAQAPAEPVQKRTAAHSQTAQSAKSIVLFSYLPQEDTVEFSDVFSPVLGNQKTFSNAQALFRTTDLIHENDREDFFRLLERCQREEGWVENTLRFYMAEGRYQWLELRLHQDDRRIAGGGAVSGTLVNLAGWKNEINRWKEKANRDALTGLYNREYFEQNVNTQLSRGAHATAAIVFIDVDDFKHVNDTLGHMFGDDVLCYVAKRILGVFRHTDVTARYGGDEFVVFAASISRTVLEDRLKQLCESFQYPYRNESLEYKISGSIGAAMYPEDGAEYETLLDHADCALYEAKKRGKDQFVLYESYMQGEPPREDQSSAGPGT